MPGPTLSAKLDPDILTRLGEIGKATKAVEGEIRTMERAALKAQNEGKNLDAATQERLKRFEVIDAKLKKMAKDDEELVKGTQDFLRDLDASRKLADANAKQAKMQSRDAEKSAEAAQKSQEKIFKTMERIDAARDLQSMFKDGKADPLRLASQGLRILGVSHNPYVEMAKFTLEQVKAGFDEADRNKSVDADFLSRMRHGQVTTTEKKQWFGEFDRLRVFGEAGDDANKLLTSQQGFSRALADKRIKPFLDEQLGHFANDKTKMMLAAVGVEGMRSKGLTVDRNGNVEVMGAAKRGSIRKQMDDAVQAATQEANRDLSPEEKDVIIRETYAKMVEGSGQTATQKKEAMDRFEEVLKKAEREAALRGPSADALAEEELFRIKQRYGLTTDKSLVLSKKRSPYEIEDERKYVMQEIGFLTENFRRESYARWNSHKVPAHIAD